ncbi:MAG: hypothetical protein PHE59_04290 [Patescibacteria group bacterium]|nr:hypothetical protein [Patescibacteria group bacterium]MDD5164219.1 hypothetical protein [Patescibacteria group bacterium]MDD5534637.1 hypothetical protein [Patescibacteria group bacterium]
MPDDDNKEAGISLWTDERGKKVKILSHFSQVYIDEEIKKLNAKYDIWQYDGESRLSTLGSAGLEDFVAKILILVRGVVGDHCISLYGIKKKELEIMAIRNHYCYDYIPRLINAEYLREKWIEGDLVVFPTEELLQNQRIPVRK